MILQKNIALTTALNANLPNTLTIKVTLNSHGTFRISTKSKFIRICSGL